eukprot:scaffold5395_cov126-Cylindrotheca_fusiformis.AAC.11
MMKQTTYLETWRTLIGGLFDRMPGQSVFQELNECKEFCQGHGSSANVIFFGGGEKGFLVRRRNAPDDLS